MRFIRAIRDQRSEALEVVAQLWLVTVVKKHVFKFKEISSTIVTILG